MKNNKTLCVIPAHNEQETIGQVLNKLKPYQEKGFIDKTLVINDGSDDKTPEIAKKHGAEVVNHVINRGIGASQQTGYEIALEEGYDFVVQIDSDGQHDPSYLPSFLEELKKGKHDMIIASRFLNQDSSIPLIRKMGIKFFSNFVSLTTRRKITDITSGYRLYNVKKLNQLEKLNTHHWAIEQTLDALTKNQKIKEIPVKMTNRPTGKSQFDNLKTLFYYPFKMLDVFLKFTMRKVLE